MGIPAYFAFIVKNHSNIISKFVRSAQQCRTHNLYLDCNSIIYDAVHSNTQNANTENAQNTDRTSKPFDESAIIRAVCEKIDQYVREIGPSNTVLIAFDGVAPVAKLDQQRARRFKTVYQKEQTSQYTTSTKWDTSAITPGTAFMTNLNRVVSDTYANTSENHKRLNVSNILVSGSDECGEGEHKIFAYMRNNAPEHVNSNTVIYGLDADLIMLSMTHLHITNNIYLYRETPHFIQMLNSDLAPNEMYVLNIHKLASVITADMTCYAKTEININIVEKPRIYDYILLCFFLGNDFLPHFPAINIRTGGIDKMMAAYKSTIGTHPNEVLTDGTTIHWHNLKKLVRFLADREEEYIQTETKLRDRREKMQMPNISPEDKLKRFDAMPTYTRTLEKYINPFKFNWQDRYYRALFNTPSTNTNASTNTNTNTATISINYLEGLEWTLKYYTRGCPNWRWYYKYNYPPLLKDLENYIPHNSVSIMRDQPPNPVSSTVQLCYVLPKQSLSLLPEHLHTQLLTHRKHWYEPPTKFVWAYCRYFWESHVDLSHIRVEEIEEFVENIQNPPKQT